MFSLSLVLGACSQGSDKNLSPQRKLLNRGHTLKHNKDCVELRKELQERKTRLCSQAVAKPSLGKEHSLCVRELRSHIWLGQESSIVRLAWKYIEVHVTPSTGSGTDLLVEKLSTPWQAHGPLPTLVSFHSSKRTDCQVSMFTYSLEKWRRSLPPPLAHHERNPRPAAAGARRPSYPWQDEGREAPHHCPTGLGEWVSTDGCQGPGSELDATGGNHTQVSPCSLFQASCAPSMMESEANLYGSHVSA